MKTKPLKRGTRVAFIGFDSDADDFGTVTAWHPSWGNVDKPTGYVPVRFDCGGIVLVHSTRLAPFCEVRA
jgi:hypothetical protein